MKLDEKKLVDFFESALGQAIKGVPGDGSVYHLVSKHLDLNNFCPNQTSESLIRSHLIKSTTLGFVSNLGGITFIPFFLAADVLSSYYIQMRLIASIAHLHGHDPESEFVKKFIFDNLFVSKNWTKEMTNRSVKGISSKLLLRVGRKGIGQTGRLLPVAAGLIGAGSNFNDCRKVGESALRFFSKPKQECA